MAGGEASCYINKTGQSRSVENFTLKILKEESLYLQLITAVDPKALRLTPQDNDIYELFRKSFPDLNVEVIDVDAMKSEEGKAVGGYTQFVHKLVAGVM